MCARLKASENKCKGQNTKRKKLWRKKNLRKGTEEEKEEEDITYPVTMISQDVAGTCKPVFSSIYPACQANDSDAFEFRADHSRRNKLLKEDHCCE